MFKLNYSISQKVLKYIGRIEAAKSLIDNAALVPAWEAKFQAEAKARTVHYGTRLEGNDLSLTQAKLVIEEVEEQKLASGKTKFLAEKVAQKAGVIGRERDIQEVINYRNVLEYIDSLSIEQQEDNKHDDWLWVNQYGINHRVTRRKDPPFLKEGNLKLSQVPLYLEKDLLAIHRLTTEKVLPPEKSGCYRKSRVVVKDAATGKVIYRPPAPVEVAYQVDEFLTWLNLVSNREEHPVVRAAVSHYELVRIHPFVDGNGRVARAFATLVLFREGYDIKKFFSLEEYYDKDPVGYYQALRSVERQKGDLTTWIEYFSLGLAYELEKVKEKVKRISLDAHLRDRAGKQISVSERQIKLIEKLKEIGQLSVPEARQVLPMISDDTILRDFNDLIKKKIIKRVGSTKGARYRLG